MSNTPSEPKQKYDATEIPEAPEGWSGPFHKTYLPKVSKNPDTDKNFKSFKTFDEAVAAANELDEGCAGITKTSTGYSLRIGPEGARESREGFQQRNRILGEGFRDSRDR